MREWTADADDDGQRLDVVLVRHVAEMSRAKARVAVAAGEVTLNGRRARKGDRVADGDRIALGVEPTPADFPARPDPTLPLVVLYEDAQLLVVDKAAGVPTHPLRADETGTLAGALVARYPELAGVGYRAREPGIVHRLDTDTSGVLLVARDVATFEALASALRRGEIAKSYLALVANAAIVPQEIALPLQSMKKDPRRVEPGRAAGSTSGARRARSEHARVTRVVSVERVGDWSLVTVSAPRAGRHQIRAHLASLGAPLASDALYGGPPLTGLTRHFLHAAELTFVHPTTGKRLSVAAPLPADLEAALRTARGDRPAR